MKWFVPLLCLCLLFLAGSVHATTPDKGNPMPSPSLAATNNGVALKLYKALAAEQPEGNLVISPYSLFSAFALLEAGTAGDTRKQMRAFFGISDETALNNLAVLNEKLSANEDFTLLVANALFVQKDYPIKDAYLESAAVLGSEVKEENFPDKEASAKSINAWASEKTKGKIPAIVSPDTLSAAMKLAIGNAIYLKAKWLTPFDPEYTEDRPFTLSNGTKINVPTMFDNGHYAYFENADVQVLDMPYKGNALSMTILLPRKNLRALEEKLHKDPSYLPDIISGVTWQKVIVRLPKFKTASGFELSEMLKENGLGLPFGEAADLSGINGISCAMDPQKCLLIGAAFHRTYIDVNEEGTEAAAVTVLLAPAGAARSAPPKEFTADHPFLLLIREKETGLILFIGRVENPALTE
jgi:serpin B